MCLVHYSLLRHDSIVQQYSLLQVPLDEIKLENGGSANDKYSIKKVEDIEKQNNQLKEEVSLTSRNKSYFFQVILSPSFREFPEVPSYS